MKFLRRWFKSSADRGKEGEGWSRDESSILQLAREFAEREGLPWLEPVHAEPLRTASGAEWRVTTNWLGRGHSVHISVDDGTGDVALVRILPR
jgi:hypothetical protein